MTADPLARFRSNLADIADCYATLAAQHSQQIRDERTKPGHHRDREHYGQPDGTMVPADPVASAMPSGPTKDKHNGPIVSGSHEAPVPVSLDLVDLTSTARHGSLDVAQTSPWPEDQIGDLAVATELDFWVRDIADLCGEALPLPTVPVLAMWLWEPQRAGWALDHYGAWDEMAVTVDRIARRLHAIVNPGKPRAEQKAAPCPACEEPTLEGDGERVWCTVEDCGRVLTEAEYTEWSRSVIVKETLGGEGMTAAAIAIQYGRSKESVHWLAHKHGWAKSDGKQRPVLYLAEDVERTMSQMAERATRRTTQLDTARERKG